MYDVEHRIVTPLGLVKWVHERATVERAADGTPTRLVGVVRDISDTRLAEEALRASRGRLQAIVENMPVLMTALDDEGHFVFWNKECERVTGFTADEVLADVDFIHRFITDPVDRARMRRDVPMPGVEFRDWELTITCNDGTKRTIAWSNITGECPLPEWSTWAVGVDVTERKQLEEQFLQSQKMEAIGRLAGGIAHDFNNLLTVVLGYTDVILGEIATSHPHRPALEQVKRAGERAAALTRQLLLFTRRQVVEARVVDLNAIVRELDRMLRRLIGEDLELDIRTVGESCPIKTDPGQIEQVLMNLAVNARDAMPNGGRLVIETALQTVTAAPGRAPHQHAGRIVGLPARVGQRHRHGRRHAGAHLRAVLHHQGAGPGHRPRPGDGVRHRAAERRPHRGLEHARASARSSRSTCHGPPSRDAERHAPHRAAAGQGRRDDPAGRRRRRRPPIPAAHQRSAIRPSRQRLTLLACSRHTEIIDSMALVERSVRASVGGTPRRSTVSVSSRPSRRLAAAPG